MTADQFTVYRCKNGHLSLSDDWDEARCQCPDDHDLVPVPVVPREDYDRLRAALERIRDHGAENGCDGDCATAMQEVARSALHGEEA